MGNKVKYRLRWMKYLGFMGFLGCTYFITREIDHLSGFIFFIFFYLYFKEKIYKMSPDDKLLAKAREIGIAVFLLPFISLFIIMRCYQNPLLTMLVAVITIVATVIGSTMIPYFYIKSKIKQGKAQERT